MGDNSKIEWTDATWNPVSGCSKVSQGCKNCYAERVFPRVYGGTIITKGHPPDWTSRKRQFTDVWTHADRLDQPLRWRRPRRIFVNSMSDLFHEDVPDEFIDQVFVVMAMARQHTFQILTKRPKRMFDYMNAQHEHIDDTRIEILRACAGIDGYTDRPEQDIRWPIPNVWLGVSVEDQANADKRREPIRALAENGWSTFVSYEPALGPIDWTGWEFIRWLISGGESGAKARPSHPDWHRAARDWCIANGIAYFFKQWGEWAPAQIKAGGDLGGDLRRGTVQHLHAPGNPEGFFRKGDAYVRRIGKKAAGNVLDGRTWEEYPR